MNRTPVRKGDPKTYLGHLLRQYCALPKKVRMVIRPTIHGSGLDPNTPGYHPGFQPHYVVAPMGVSTEDLRKIAEAVRDAVKDSLREEFSKIIDEKIAPLHARIDKLQPAMTTSDNNWTNWSNMEGARSYVFRAFERRKGKTQEATSTAGINLQPDDIINSHRVGNPNSKRKGPRQIIARLKSVGTKFHILCNARKFKQ